MAKISEWETALPVSDILPLTRQLVPIESAAGMLSDWDADVWLYSTKRFGRQEVFPWTRVMANGLPLTDKVNQSFWELTRRYQAVLRNELHPNERGLALSTVFGKTRTAVAVCDLAIKLGCSSLAELTAEQYQEIQTQFNQGKSGLSDKKITRGRLVHVLDVLNDLHDLFVYPQRDGLYFLNDGIRFSWLSIDDRRAVAANARDAGQTDDVPEAIVFAHITAAIEYVGLFSDDILELARKSRVIKSEPVVACRARPGEATAKVAVRLLAGVEVGRSDLLFKGNTVTKKILSQECGVDLCSLYDKRFLELIAPVERWLSSPTKNTRRQAISALRERITKFEAISRREIQRDAPRADVGLPFTGKPGAFSPWPLVSLGSGRFGGASLEEAEADLWTSCYVIILSYIAVRLGEGLTIKVDCIRKRIDGYYIAYRTSKAANSEGGTLVERPCPEIVARAVEVASKLSSDAREEFGSDDLFFVRHRHGASVLENSAVRQRIRFFGRRTGASVTEDGSERTITPNELRRFFVTMWVGYFEYAGKYESLRRFLNHAWITTTVRYGLRKNESPRLSSAQFELSVKVLSRKLLDGAGGLADLPKSIVPFIQSLKVRALPVTELFKEFREYAKDQGFMLFPMPWGYCLWHNSAAKYAQCLEASLRRIGTQRIDAKRTCEGCGGCHNLVKDHVFDPFYETAIPRHEKIARNKKASPSLRRAASQFVSKAARAIGRKPTV